MGMINTKFRIAVISGIKEEMQLERSKIGAYLHLKCFISSDRWAYKDSLLFIFFNTENIHYSVSIL